MFKLLLVAGLIVLVIALYRSTRRGRSGGGDAGGGDSGVGYAGTDTYYVSSGGDSDSDSLNRFSGDGGDFGGGGASGDWSDSSDSGGSDSGSDSGGGDSGGSSD
ncbi:hypothetical protein [Sphingomonas montanisoli]|uniref:Uncharacterized protein n=1 Tax=Sphingomonas montanisoli TaxID=2606412 RepID=A0A5D9C9P0_9SPHN|nr:hypothetical protein [Sphingomonas montanisoli]TZG28043.1 hypothetical protein FYJ91_10980 [Sphingomonas montanisoli]